MDTMGKSYLITGANVGLGWDTCRQLAMREDTEKVYLACRSKEKATHAIRKLMAAGCVESKLEFIPFDASVSKQEIQKSTVESLKLKNRRLDGLILNAGGPGGDGTGKAISPNYVLDIVQINLIAHIQLVQLLTSEALLQDDCHIIYSGSESARGYLAPVPRMRDTPKDFQYFMEGKSYKWHYDIADAYGTVKGIAALYFAAFAKVHHTYKVFTVSPGATFGTEILSQKSIARLGWLVHIVWVILSWFGWMHRLEHGALRYVKAVTGDYDSEFPSGTFVASLRLAVGPVCDQTELSGGKQYGDLSKQNAAYQALSSYL
mmetsp:Transcript_22001/g.31566  ORF Transcript_22001/g.31566 Transcript_22001/m.31566 type:complete len:318 (-) Transcript_22001:97-1050(-)